MVSCTDDIVFAADEDALTFSEQSGVTPGPGRRSMSRCPWHVVVVDDDEEVHSVTRMVLRSAEFHDRPIQLHSAYSASEAMDLVSGIDDAAVVLLDVVMETDDAGLRFVEFLRRELGNHAVRIILRTGQPGQAPERRAIVDYDINDYKTKTELTAQRLFTAVVTALRSYEEIVSREKAEAELRRAQANLEQRVAERTRSLQEATRRLEQELQERKRAEAERRQLEAQLRHNQKLEAIGTLASGVAHEINNPINGIMNYAELIRDRTSGNDEIAALSAEIIHETRRVARIVRNLLAFARQDHQQHGPARIKDIIEDTLSLLRTVVRGDQIQLEVCVSEDLPRVPCHSQQIQQVLMNLLTNARDALNERHEGFDENKILRISARQFEHQGRTWVRITVEDHGTGMTPELQERIFEPFFTTKNRTLGTGLGLSISHRIAQEHGGCLLVESELDVGTRFHLDLPAAC